MVKKQMFVLQSLLLMVISVLSIAVAQPVLAAPKDSCNSAADVNGCLANNPIVKDLNNIITVLAGTVIIVIVGSLIFSGIQYSAAGDNPQKVNDAKKRITGTLLAFVVFALMYAFLQWLIPGGIF